MDVWGRFVFVFDDVSERWGNFEGTRVGTDSCDGAQHQTCNLKAFHFGESTREKLAAENEGEKECAKRKI